VSRLRSMDRTVKSLSSMGRDVANVGSMDRGMVILRSKIETWIVSEVRTGICIFP
jgi:hypothetical protein